jgi:hypothetical protein
VQGRDAEDLSQLPANQNDAAVSLEAIAQNPWSAVWRRLPENADRTVLERTAFAARECSKAAFAAGRVAEVVEPEVVRVYGWIGDDASARYREASRLLQALPLDEISKVSPLIDREHIQEKSLAHLMVMAALVERPHHGVIRADGIEENPWSIIRSELRGAEPELLRKVQDVAMGLVLDAWERRDASDTREEAWLWDWYGAAARSVYAEAECEVAVVLGIEREGSEAVQRLGPENRSEVKPRLEQDRAALIDMVGEDSYRAVNGPVPDDADATTLVRLSDDLDAALDRLDALNRSGATGISPDYIAWQYGKAAARQDEVERRLGEMDWEIDRNLSPSISSSPESEVSRSEAMYEHELGITRKERGPGHDGDDGRSR